MYRDELPQYLIPPGTTLFAMRDGLWAAGQRMRKVDLGSRELERELVSRLTSGKPLDDLAAKYSSASLTRALDVLTGAGIIAAAPSKIVFANLLGKAGPPSELGSVRVVARPRDVRGAGLLVLLAPAESESLVAWLRAARAEAVPVLACWLSDGTALAFGFDDSEARPCLHCALLFDGSLRSAAARVEALSDGGAARVEAAAIGDAPRGPMEQLALAWLGALAQPGALRPTSGRALTVDGRTWRVAWESYPAHPSCFCAGRVAAASAEPPPSSWREAQGRRFSAVICADAGGAGRPARALFRQSRLAFEQSVDDFGVASATGENATLRAFAEGVERFCMLHAPPDVARTPRLRLAEPALEHDQLVSLLFREEERERPGFRHPRYTGELPLDWSWATHATTAARVLVPTSLVGRPSARSARLVDATSNGYAAHTDRARAVELALLEIVERDAVLHAWYLTRRMPRVAAELAVAAPLRGTETRAFLATADIDLPVVLAVARLPDGGLRATSAAGPSFDDAWRKAALELQSALEALGRRAARAAPELGATTRCDGPLEHLAFYLTPERARPAIELLWAMSESVRVDALAARWPAVGDASSLARVTAALEAARLDPWIVDRSLPDVFGTQWHVARALVPGTLEISWGHAYRRLDAPRVRAALTGGAVLNPLPHPIA